MSPDIRTMLKQGAGQPGRGPDLAGAMIAARRRGATRRVALASVAAAAVVALAVAGPSLVTAFRRTEAPAGPVPAPAASEPPAMVVTGVASRRVGGDLMKVGLSLSPAHIVEGDVATMTLINEGELRVAYDPSFVLEHKTVAGWIRLNRGHAFRPLLHLRPGSRSEPERIEVYVDEAGAAPLPPGQYRVTKEVSLPSQRVTLRVTTAFQVVRRAGRGTTHELDSSYEFERYPGNQWYGPRGEPLEPGASPVDVSRGSERCGWGSAALLHFSWPLGTREDAFTTDHIYVRDPGGVVVPLPGDFDESADLPGGARYSGYRTDFMELWLAAPPLADPAPPKDAYLVFEDHVERWPRATKELRCE